MKTTLLADKRGRKTVTISTQVYESVSDFILSMLKETGEITFTSLLEQASQNASLPVEGDMSWSFLKVKRDLEARGIIKVSIGLGPKRIQMISLNKKRKSVSIQTDHFR